VHAAHFPENYLASQGLWRRVANLRLGRWATPVTVLRADDDSIVTA
jgi:hypothetical protein